MHIAVELGLISNLIKVQEVAVSSVLELRSRNELLTSDWPS